MNVSSSQRTRTAIVNRVLRDYVEASMASHAPATPEPATPAGPVALRREPDGAAVARRLQSVTYAS